MNLKREERRWSLTLCRPDGGWAYEAQRPEPNSSFWAALLRRLDIALGPGVTLEVHISCAHSAMVYGVLF